ncbi:MAG: RagB/SusD family nutrient uptake outer membrane protein [Candidatus Symbiothrix sp.]|jgi:hypothetical protein|nr:RagB/SusD family nutrient uptake outer membrane protein [Candidatus Symbiothrix sp.]
MLIVLMAIQTFVSCDDFLDKSPYGTLSEEDLTSVQSIENSCIAAYAGIGNDEINRPMSLWGYGNVRADDAYKGGGGSTDNTELYWFEISSPSLANEIGGPDVFWYRNYIVVSRINSTLRALNNVTDNEMPTRQSRMAEMHFLRAHIHFYNKILFKHIPYIVETMSREDISNESNVALTDDELWQKIIDDLEYAYQNLPTTQSQVGRPNKYAAAAYLAKAYLYKAYRQDEQHNVTEINQQELQKVIEYADVVIASPYHLESDYAYNFLPGQYENGAESIFAIQYSMDDGTTWGRLNMGCVLTAPSQGVDAQGNLTNPGMDFHKPSQSLVNAFITKDGLPDFDAYNEQDYNEATDKADPRLYHTVALPGKPYKYTDRLYTTQCTRTSDQFYGYYSSLKENVEPGSEYYVRAHKEFPWYGNPKNWIVLRYADVLLFKAEALIETGSHADALPLINQIRNRAKASTGLIGFANNVDIQPYNDGVNCTWNQGFARKALRWERRVEMACEGFRFFDLVRWGICAETMNAYYQKEQALHTYYQGAYFEKNKNEFMPVPIQQLRWSKDIYEQNYGWK